jgi:hypothetical protein
VSKRTKILLGIGVIAALVVAWQVAAFATLAGSNFEIDPDANLRIGDPTPGTDDWANIPQTPATAPKLELRQTDKVNGTGDNAYAGGAKEDDTCPAVKEDSIPPNKSDLLSFHVYEEAATAGNKGFMNLAWSRVSEPEGSTLMDFEFNQKTTPCQAGRPNVVRTGDGSGPLVDDLLIEYSLEGGGTNAFITARKWTGSAWGPTEVLSANNALCGNAPCAEGTINSSEIPAAQSDGLISSGVKEPNTFGEAQIDLRYVFQGNSCATFGNAMLKSRSAPSFDSALKDFVSPLNIDVANCAKVIMHKEAGGANQEFLYTHDLKTDPALTNLAGTTFDDTVKFALNDNSATNPPTTTTRTDTKTYTNVLLNSAADPTYVISEDALPAGWQFDSLVCGDTSAAGAAANPLHTGVTTTIDPATRKVTFALDSATDVAECTFTNSQLITTLGTTQSFVPQDTATVGGSPNGGWNGTVDFRLYSGLDCGGATPPAALYTEENVLLNGTTAGSTASTNNDGVPATVDQDAGYTITGTGGDFSWKVKYEGDTVDAATSDTVAHPDKETCIEVSRVTIDNDNTVAPNPLAAVTT